MIKRYYILSSNIDYFYKLLSNYVKRFRVCNLELELYIKSTVYSYFLESIKLHSNFLIQTNNDIICIDFMYKNFRFKLIYYFLSLLYTQRIKCIIALLKKKSLSILSYFIGSNWIEREIWDFFGIFFVGSEDLRRILSDYGFKGYALRKDFILSGYYILYYNDLTRKLNYLNQLLNMRESVLYKIIPQNNFKIRSKLKNYSYIKTALDKAAKLKLNN